MTKQLTITPEEIERRNRYWFVNWREFRSPVLVITPADRTAYVGMEHGQFFGAVPISYTGSDTEQGNFWITPEGGAIVVTATHTYMWDLYWTHVVYNPDYVEMRDPNQPVVYIRGPVAAPLVGAITEFRLAHGLPAR